MKRIRVILAGLGEAEKNIYYLELKKHYEVEYVSRKNLLAEIAHSTINLIVIQANGMDYESEKLAMDISVLPKKWAILIVNHGEFRRRIKNLKISHLAHDSRSACREIDRVSRIIDGGSFREHSSDKFTYELLPIT